MTIDIPYYRSNMPIDIPDNRIKAILSSQPYTSGLLTERQAVERALENPVKSKTLADMAAGKNNILIITSDHTRPLPSRITMPLLLKEARRSNPNTHIKILLATGFLRATTESELKDKFGIAIYDSEDIVMHDAFDETSMVSKGILPSGGELKINKLVDWTDLIVAEGFIEPHFFAGFSGGRKSILPGICSNDTIMYNHNAQFITHPKSRTGVLDDNPLHRDMLSAAGITGLAFILNVALDSNKRIVAAFAGNPVEAHIQGCEFVKKHSLVPAVKADIVVTSNGGYPLDQNIYQTVKGMTAAESCVNPDGVIIIISSCVDGHGGEGFYNWFSDAESPREVMQRIKSIPPSETCPDQWEAQILARILTKCKQAIIVSNHAEPHLIENMHMKHAATFNEALEMADALLGKETEIVIIPDGIGVIPEEN